MGEWRTLRHRDFGRKWNPGSTTEEVNFEQIISGKNMKRFVKLDISVDHLFILFHLFMNSHSIIPLFVRLRNQSIDKLIDYRYSIIFDYSLQPYWAR